MPASQNYVRAMQALGLSHPDASRLLGISMRTSQRYVRGGAFLTPRQLELLAAETYPVDPQLSADLARDAGTTLEELGLGARPEPVVVPPSPPPALVAQPQPQFAPEDIIDAVVCAAAEAMGAMPAAVRPALLAACRRARKLGLDLAAMEAALGGP